MKPEQGSILVAFLVTIVAMAAADGWIPSLAGFVQRPPAGGGVSGVLSATPGVVPGIQVPGEGSTLVTGVVTPAQWQQVTGIASNPGGAP